MKRAKGFIVLNREILDWEWYDDIKTKVLFLHLLLTANHKEQKWQGKVVGRGELITSIAHLAKETGLSEQNIRTSLNKLKSTGEITLQSTNRYTLICVVNWGKFQDFDVEDNKQNNEQTNKQPTINQQTTNNKQQCNKETKEQINILFEQLWQMYPSKKGKGQVSDARKKALFDIGLEEMTRAIKRYKQGLEKDKWRKAQNGSTFFNSGYVDYLDANYKEGEDNGADGYEGCFGVDL